MERTKKKIKIGIIGSGITGASSAYFLKQLLGENVEIIIFEKNDSVGGRLATYEFNNRIYELGGSLLHPSNKYMQEFLEILNIEKKEQENNEFFGLYDSKGIIIKTGDSFLNLKEKIQFLKYFGLSELVKFKYWIQAFTKDFSKIYQLQDNGFVFNNLKEFLINLNPQLYKLSQQSIEKGLIELGFNDGIVNKLSNVACLSNYGQSIDIDGFVGAVSLAGTIDKLWSIKNGNKLVPIKLIEKSLAELKLNTKVKLISKDLVDSNMNMIIYETEDKTEIIDNSFDYVILAFPIYKNVIGNDFKIDFEIKQDFSKLEMQITNTYIIYGELILFDNLPSDKRIQLHSVDPSVSYRTICVQLPCDYSNEKDKDLYLNSRIKLYKIFSENVLNKDNFDKIFKTGYQAVRSIAWEAYPKYDKNPTFKEIPNVILDDERSRILYPNSLEWSSSCIELCVISARNVANIIAIKENVKINNFFSIYRSESNLPLIVFITLFFLIFAFIIKLFF